MKKIGLFFGTYNPIHVGHLVIANHLANYTELDEVWLVVSPQNPLKKKVMLIRGPITLPWVAFGRGTDTRLSLWSNHPKLRNFGRPGVS